MRAFNHHIGSPSMALVTENVDVGTAFKQAMARLRRKTRHLLCTFMAAMSSTVRARKPSSTSSACCVAMKRPAGRSIAAIGACTS